MSSEPDQRRALATLDPRPSYINNKYETHVYRTYQWDMMSEEKTRRRFDVLIFGFTKLLKFHNVQVTYLIFDQVEKT